MIGSFSGRTPVIAESAFISEAAYVIGHVRIGNDVLIGINATLLHDVVIGDYCIIAAAALGISQFDEDLKKGVRWRP